MHLFEWVGQRFIFAAKVLSTCDVQLFLMRGIAPHSLHGLKTGRRSYKRRRSVVLIGKIKIEEKLLFHNFGMYIYDERLV